MSTSATPATPSSSSSTDEKSFSKRIAYNVGYEHAKCGWERHDKEFLGGLAEDYLDGYADGLDDLEAERLGRKADAAD